VKNEDEKLQDIIRS